MARAPLAAEIETLPEADRLDDFPHPRETRGLFGLDAAQTTLCETLASGRMHHAWLLSGPAGIGKATLAYQFARAVLARPEERDLFGQGMAIEPNSPTDRQVRALSHPALLVIRRTYDPKTKRFSQTIPVDEVRRLKTFLALSPEEQGWRVVIVDSADDMNAKRRQRTSEVARRAAAANDLPAHHVSAWAAPDDDTFQMPFRRSCATCRYGLEARCRAGADECRKGRTGSSRLGSAIASLAGKRAPRADT